MIDSRPSILITGCSSGIGLDAATTMAARGWRVFATCRNKPDHKRLAALGLEPLRLELADSDSIQTAVAHVTEATGGRLNALFNNGAHAIPGAVEDLPRDALREIFEVNLFGQFDLIRHVLPIMRRQEHGRLINCSSVLGFSALRWRGAYNSTKFAMEGLTDTLRRELRDTPIHVVLVQPGPITSRIRQNSVPHFERWIDWRGSARAAQYEKELLPRLYEDRGPDRFELPPAAVTRKLIHALESPRPRARYRVTTPTHVMAALNRLLPTAALDYIASRL